MLERALDAARRRQYGKLFLFSELVFNNKNMATFDASFLGPTLREALTYKDQESGCQVYNDRQAFELCKQTFYIKKQSDSLAEINNTDTKTDNVEELQQLRAEVAYLRDRVDFDRNDSNQEFIIPVCLGALFIIFFLAAIFIMIKIIWKK